MATAFLAGLAISSISLSEASYRSAAGFLGGRGQLVHGADLILLHGKIWTGEPASPPSSKSEPAKFAQAVAIANRRILAVGDDAEIQSYAGPNTKVVNLKGRLTVPGLIDSHAHFIRGGFQLLSVDLKNARSEAEFTHRIADKAKTLAPGQWLMGGEWDEQAWPSAKLPTRQMIDAATANHPAFLSRYDGHAVLANTLALKLAGVTRVTPDPEGGIIVRDAAGEPTGVFKDTAQDLIAKAIPPPTEAEMSDALRAALAEAARVGLTSVQSVTVYTDSWNGSFTGEVDLLRRAELEGWLTCRIYKITPITEWQKLRDGGLERDMGDDFIKMGAVKAFADGSLGSATAWMNTPFADDPANRGMPLPLMDPPSKMEALARKKVMLHFNEIRPETDQDKKGELFAKTISVIGEHIVELCEKLNIYVGLSSPPTLASSLSTPPSQPDLVASPTSSISSFSSCNAEMLEFLRSKFGPNYSPCDFIDVERYACYAMRKPRYELRQVKNLLRDVHVVTSQRHCNDGQACWISYRANLYSRVFHMCVDPFLRPQLIPSVTPHGSPDSCPLVIGHGICEEGNGYHPSCCRPSHMQLGNSRINNTESQKKRHISSNIHTLTPIDHTPIRVLSSSSDIGPPAPFPSPSPPRTDSLSTSSSASASSSLSSSNPKQNGQRKETKKENRPEKQAVEEKQIEEEQSEEGNESDADHDAEEIEEEETSP